MRLRYIGMRGIELFLNINEKSLATCIQLQYQHVQVYQEHAN